MIDINKGVETHWHSSGMQVHMYVNEPGVFRNSHGTIVSKELAAEAGYDVDRLVGEADRRKRIADAIAAVDQEFNQAQNETGGPVLVEEASGFKLLDIGLGRFSIQDPDGNQVVPRPLPEKEARLLFSKLVPAAPEAVKPEQVQEPNKKAS